MRRIHLAARSFHRPRTNPRPELIDQRREAAIASAVADLLTADDRRQRIVAIRALAVLIRSRSPRQVRQLELQRGLRPFSPAYVDGHHVGFEPMGKLAA